MQVMGISGMPGSGKNLVSEMAAEKGAIIISMGDIIREEAKKGAKVLRRPLSI